MDARSILSTAPAGPITPERQERIVEHALVLINLASNIAAMAAAIASLVDIVLRHHNMGGSSR